MCGFNTFKIVFLILQKPFISFYCSFIRCNSMFKPNIVRLKQCPYYPQKEYFSLEDIERYFLNKELHIAEKLDGSPIYNAEEQILYEDLSHTSSVDYSINNYPRQIALMKYVSFTPFSGGIWLPFSSINAPWFYSEKQQSSFLIAQTIKQSVIVNSVDKFFDIITECLKHETMFPSASNNIIEGIVVSTKEGNFGKIHNKEFLELIINAENKHKKRQKRT